MSNGIHLLGGGVLIAGIVAFVVLAFAAMVSVLRAPQPCGMKIVWFCVVWAAPLLGSIAWFAFGKPYAYQNAR
ncbi:PLD nuclease N-terminal domain-containing protein [Amycolatopsis pigmentata]|uniref:PLD nuclease N-terminal domain-containing protein n=1 Tax=Amycolatopsis pigmentata TaxID=450801 RepID=A0ABW5G410_9PSEU